MLYCVPGLYCWFNKKLRVFTDLISALIKVAKYIKLSTASLYFLGCFHVLLFTSVIACSLLAAIIPSSIHIMISFSPRFFRVSDLQHCVQRLQSSMCNTVFRSLPDCLKPYKDVFSLQTSFTSGLLYVNLRVIVCRYFVFTSI